MVGLHEPGEAALGVVRVYAAVGRVRGALQLEEREHAVEYRGTRQAGRQAGRQADNDAQPKAWGKGRATTSSD